MGECLHEGWIWIYGWYGLVTITMFVVLKQRRDREYLDIPKEWKEGKKGGRIDWMANVVCIQGEVSQAQHNLSGMSVRMRITEKQ